MLCLEAMFPGFEINYTHVLWFDVLQKQRFPAYAPGSLTADRASRSWNLGSCSALDRRSLGIYNSVIPR